MWNVQDSGIDPDALRKFIDEQIYTLPGTDAHRDVFSILLTGSRACGAHKPNSDVDLDVLCPQSVYDSVHRASLEAGLVNSRSSFFRQQADWRRYFGADWIPHFKINTLESVQRQFQEHDDVALWIWTNARIITDPNGQFQRVRDGFQGYPRNVLVRKLKYRWLLCWHWAINVYPLHHSSDDELLPAALSFYNATSELLKVFFLVEGRPFPYAEKLSGLAGLTKLGQELGPVVQRYLDIAAGNAEPDLSPWQRLDRAISLFHDDNDKNPDCQHVDAACFKAMVACGMDADWLENDYENMDELLLGKLGPPP